MGSILSAHPSVPETIQTVTLGSQQYRVRLTWRRRTRGWYMDLFTLDETPLAMGRRISAGVSPLFGLVLDEAVAPDGYFVVRGVDGYAREDFGTSLTVAFYTREELAAAKAVADAAEEASREGEPDPLDVVVTIA